MNACHVNPTSALESGDTTSGEALASFRQAVIEHFRQHARDFPWRHTYDPYQILISEVMLQQTQVARVCGKYEDFVASFPNIRALAEAPTADVLRAWQGLGYNRRALGLQRSAQIMLAEHGGSVPRSVTQLLRLPGIGPATASAVCAFAYNMPVSFIETNIRAAFLHFFFRDGIAVPDKAVLPLVTATLDRQNPRDWYYALMDYGNWVKRTYPNPSRRSKHHSIQSSFAGSRRQLRAQILRILLAAVDAPCLIGNVGCRAIDAKKVASLLPHREASEVESVIRDLAAEGFLGRNEDYRII